jgi:ABC-type sugar transport system substrate-binding protein
MRDGRSYNQRRLLFLPKFESRYGFFPLLLTTFLAAAMLADLSCRSKQAATQPAQKKIITIGYSAPELFAGQNVICSSFVKHAEGKGWKVLVANANNDPATQLSQISYFLEKGVDAVVAVPIDSEGISEAIQQARKAGIPFYCIDRAPIGCQARLSVLSDNYLAGVQSGEYLVSALAKRYGKPQGVVLELQGNLRQNVAKLRGGGFHSVVDKYPEIRVISRSTDWRSLEHEEHTKAVLDSEPRLDAIYFHSDGAGMIPVLTVLKARGRLLSREHADHIILVSVDAMTPALRAIRDGFADEASSQPVLDFGILADWIESDLAGKEFVEAVVNHPGKLWSPAVLKKKDTGWELLLRTTTVTKENVDDPRLWGNQLPLLASQPAIYDESTTEPSRPGSGN